MRRWFDERVLPTFAGRVLPSDLLAAQILATYPIIEHAPLDDALIATARRARNDHRDADTRRVEPRINNLGPALIENP